MNKDVVINRSINDLYRIIAEQELLLARVQLRQNATTQPVDPNYPGQAVNQVRNGSYAHSVNSWAGNTNGTADQDYECAYWFSHSDADDTAMELANTLTTLGRTEDLTATRTDYTQQFLLMGA